jgi:hypothetical protein
VGRPLGWFIARHGVAPPGWRRNNFWLTPPRPGAVRQVDLLAGTIRLDPGTTKNREGREVAMTTRVRALLQAACVGKQPTDAVLTRNNGQPVRDLRHAWRALNGGGRRARPAGARLATQCSQGAAPRRSTRERSNEYGRVENPGHVSALRYRQCYGPAGSRAGAGAGARGRSVKVSLTVREGAPAPATAARKPI